MADDLWLGDDPMPSCDPCHAGDHAHCLDLMTMPGTPFEKYGVFACGCENEVHYG